ncbi:hypothetical protein BLNAU_5163 [Blattamonas nauphoetae]|uniref:Uncharacterized protein n=1 Tax=Blattamonas nauphoetae TaxID=2049346 RepID=A0ABQ9Y873_9EUKA|nr:hypothetical protein BLNAU_5163 [Blattamonas nauphoetae]
MFYMQGRGEWLCVRVLCDQHQRRQARQGGSEEQFLTNSESSRVQRTRPQCWGVFSASSSIALSSLASFLQTEAFHTSLEELCKCVRSIRLSISHLPALTRALSHTPSSPDSHQHSSSTPSYSNPNSHPMLFAAERRKARSFQLHQPTSSVPLFQISSLLARTVVKFNNPPFIVPTKAASI